MLAPPLRLRVTQDSEVATTCSRLRRRRLPNIAEAPAVGSALAFVAKLCRTVSLGEDEGLDDVGDGTADQPDLSMTARRAAT